jgi:hypothetical protein
MAPSPRLHHYPEIDIYSPLEVINYEGEEL